MPTVEEVDKKLARIIISVFGTAGDVLPCVAVARVLKDRMGHDVAFLTPRWTGFIPRVVGFPTMSVGDGREKAALSDRLLFTTRFAGMDSWRRSLVKYVQPLLADNYSECRRLIHRYSPDLVITTAQSYWGSLAAQELNIPWSSYHLYPQLSSLGGPPEYRRPKLARLLTEWLASEEQRIGLPASDVPLVAWATSAVGSVGAHDPAVYVAPSGAPPSLGFPYFDEVFFSGEAMAEAPIPKRGTFVERNCFPGIVHWSGQFGLLEGHVRSGSRNAGGAFSFCWHRKGGSCPFIGAECSCAAARFVVGNCGTKLTC